MIQVEPADPENLPEQHLRHPEHAPCDRQPLFLTKEVIPIIENQATCMPGKIEENQPKMSTLKDTILKKDDIILYVGLAGCPRMQNLSFLMKRSYIDQKKDHY